MMDDVTPDVSDQSKNANTKVKTKRNIWTVEETRYFIGLIKEKHVLKLMDGKRLRTTQIFTSLVPLMKEAGYHRDVQSMIIKFKNLKSDYYKCKRNNNKSGHEPEDYIFYDDMDDLLGHRPCTELEGFDSSSNTADTINTEDLVPVNNVTIEWYDNVPDDDRAVPGPSNTSNTSLEDNRSSSSMSELPSAHNIHKKKNKGKVQELLDEIKTSLTRNEQKMSEDKAQLELFLEKQQQMLMNFSQTMIQGMKEILHTKKRRRNDDDTTDSD